MDFVTRILPALLALYGCGLPAEEVARVRADLEGVVAQARVADERRAATIAEAMTAPPQSPTCDRSVGPEITAGTAPYRNFREIDLDDIAVPAARFAWTRNMAESYERRLSPDAQFPLTREEVPIAHRSVRDVPPQHLHEIELVITHHRDAEQVGEHSFRGGSSIGRLVVWDYQAQTVRCHVEVQSSSADMEEGNVNTALEARFAQAALGAIGL